MTSTGTLTFATGQQLKNLSFNVFGNTVSEKLAKTIVETITVASGPAIVHAHTGQGTIVDDDGGSIAPPPLPEGAQIGEIRRVSLANDGSEAISLATLCSTGYNAGSHGISASADGRYVLFDSDAANLVTGDTNNRTDMFVRDIVAATTERISVRDDETELPYGVGAALGTSERGAISTDGRYVTFIDGYAHQTYLRDRVAGTTELISAIPSGGAGYGASGTNSISADGRYVTFTSYSSNLDAAAQLPLAWPQPFAYLYVRDRQTQTTKLIHSWGTNSEFGGAAMSANGRYVAFNDVSGTLVPGDTNGCTDTFVLDLLTTTTERVSLSPTGAQLPGNFFPVCIDRRPIITGDGRYVAFAWIFATANPFGFSITGFIRDRVAGTTDYAVDASAFGIDHPPIWAMTDDGRYVGWGCACGAVIDTGIDPAPMWTDRVAGVTKQVGVQLNGTEPVDADWGSNTNTYPIGLSSDGRQVTFTSHATNLVPGDSNAAYDVFAERMA